MISSPARGETGRWRQVSDGEMRREKTEVGEADNGEELNGEAEEIRVRIMKGQKAERGYYEEISWSEKTPQKTEDLINPVIKAWILPLQRKYFSPF